MAIDRVLIVGLGSIGKRHLRIARQLLPHADIRVLRRNECDSIPEHSNGVFTSIEGVKSFLPQIAVIANPAPFHLSVANALLDCRTHLLIEKPLSTSVDDVQKIIDRSQKLGLILSTGYNLRFLLSLQKYRALLADEIVGKVLSVRCEVGQYLPSWRINIDYRSSVSAKKELGGGALLELSHELDYLRWIFGEVEWVKASISRQSQLDIDVEDIVHLTIGFSSKERDFQLIGTVNMDFIRHDATRTCIAIGSKGSLLWNGMTGEVAIYNQGDSNWTRLHDVVQDADDSYKGEWRHFIESVNRKSRPMVDGTDGLKVLHIIKAARESAVLNGIKCAVNAVGAGVK